MFDPTREDINELIDVSDLSEKGKILIKKALYMFEENIMEDEVMEILRRSANEEISSDEAIAELDKLSEEAGM